MSDMINRLTQLDTEDMVDAMMSPVDSLLSPFPAAIDTPPRKLDTYCTFAARGPDLSQLVDRCGKYAS